MLEVTHLWGDHHLGGHLQTLVKPQIERFSKKRWRASAPVLDTRSYLPRDPGNAYDFRLCDGGILKWTSPESGNWAPLNLPFVNFVTVGTVKYFFLPFRIVKFPTSLKPRKKNQLPKNTQFAFPFLFRDPFPFLLSGQFFEAVNWAWLFLGPSSFYFWTMSGKRTSWPFEQEWDGLGWAGASWVRSRWRAHIGMTYVS